jgi:hypothetical protein
MAQYPQPGTVNPGYMVEPGMAPPKQMTAQPPNIPPPEYINPQQITSPAAPTVAVIDGNAVVQGGDPMPDMVPILIRMLVTGVVLILTGFSYFILGCLMAPASGPVAEGVIVGLVALSSGIVCIAMMFKLPKLKTLNSLINWTWMFIGFGAVLLGTACGDFRFTCEQFVSSLIFYDTYVKKFNEQVALATVSISSVICTFDLVLIIFSCVMLSCSGGIRKLCAHALKRYPV